MKIASYDVSASSQRIFTSASHMTTSVKTAQALEALPAQEAPEDQVVLSQKADSPAVQEKNGDKEGSADLQQILNKRLRAMDSWKLPKDPEDLKLNMLLRMLEALTGKKFKGHQVKADSSQPRENRPQRLQGLQIATGQGGRQSLQIQQTQMYHEYEAVSYSATGVVTTADGKTISFDVQLNMSREFAAYSQTTMNLQQDRNVCDPLVINYGGTAASLSDVKFEFDLDADGKNDSISFAGPGSGFLALDKNGDGAINDGSELFGPQSGNGFQDLRAYDNDGNGWIDENDDVYSRLQVWTKDSDGNDVLFSLKELDVGAIYLGDMATQFTVDGGNGVNGYVRSTSFFLRDSGGAGTIQHIDLVT